MSSKHMKLNLYRSARTWFVNAELVVCNMQLDAQAFSLTCHASQCHRAPGSSSDPDARCPELPARQRRDAPVGVMRPGDEGWAGPCVAAGHGHSDPACGAASRRTRHLCYSTHWQERLRMCTASGTRMRITV